MFHNVNYLPMLNNVGEVIKKRREELGKTQEQLANEVGVKPSTISLYETGARKPEIERIKKLSQALGINETLLLGIVVPKADLDIALRAQTGLTAEDIKQIKSYVNILKHGRKVSNKTTK